MGKCQLPEMRAELAKYPNLVLALEAVCRALMLPYRLKDIAESEIPPHHPAPGAHHLVQAAPQS